MAQGGVTVTDFDTRRGLEGASWSDGSVYFEAGDAKLGQIWQYTPRGALNGELTMRYESNDSAVLDHPDSLTVSPRGGVLVCEDGDGEAVDGGTNLVRYLAPTRRTGAPPRPRIARNG